MEPSQSPLGKGARLEAGQLPEINNPLPSLKELKEIYKRPERMPVGQLSERVRDQLERSGYVVFNNRVVGIDRLSQDQLAQALGLTEKHSSSRIEQGTVSLQASFERLFADKGRLIPSAHQQQLVLSALEELRSRASQQKSVSTNSYLLLARELSGYLQERKVPSELREAFIETVFTRRKDKGRAPFLKSESALAEILHCEVTWNTRAAQSGDFSRLIGIKVNDVSAAVAREKADFIEKFGSVPGIQKIVHEAFEQPLEWRLEQLENGLRTIHLEARPWHGIIRDNYAEAFRYRLASLPESTEEFLRLCKEEGAAKAFIKTSGFCIDDEYLYHSPELQKVLIALHLAEFGENVQLRFNFLQGLSVGPGRTEKLQRLCITDPDFEALLKARINKQNSFVDELPANQEITRRLTTLGVDSDIFYRGISAERFILEEGRALDERQIREAAVQEFTRTIQSMLQGDFVRGIDRYLQKVSGQFQAEKIGVPEGLPLEEFILSKSCSDNIEAIKIVCRTSVEWCSQKNNIVDNTRAVAAVFHFNNVLKFLRGEVISEASHTGQLVQMAVSAKDPVRDIDIGNDGGCCIGIYTSEEGYDSTNGFVGRFLESLELAGIEPVTSNGQYLPVYLSDRATVLTEIKVGRERKGMALAFAGENELGQSLFMVNSIELGKEIRHTEAGDLIELRMWHYLKAFATASNFPICLCPQE